MQQRRIASNHFSENMIFTIQILFVLPIFILYNTVHYANLCFFFFSFQVRYILFRAHFPFASYRPALFLKFNLEKLVQIAATTTCDESQDFR